MAAGISGIAIAAPSYAASCGKAIVGRPHSVNAESTSR
jgi:hypothetical protein